MILLLMLSATFANLPSYLITLCMFKLHAHSVNLLYRVVLQVFDIICVV